MTYNAAYIRFEDFMGDQDDLDEVNLIGPFPDPASRARELARLDALPLGAPQFNGGYRFFADRTTADGADWVVEPAIVAGATTVKEFFDAFFGWQSDDGDDAFDVHPDQVAIGALLRPGDYDTEES